MKKYLNKFLLLLAIGIVAVPAILIRDFVEGQVVSGPVSGTIEDAYRDNSELSIGYLLPTDTIEQINPTDDVVPMIVRHYGKDTDRFNIRILPFISSSENTALYDLETYLVKYVGAVTKYQQREYMQKGVQVAQIALNLFSHLDENYYSVYTSIKNDNRTYILTTGYYTELTSKDAFNVNNSKEYAKYAKILDTFKVKSEKVKHENFNILTRNDIGELILSLYKDFNSEFMNTI